MEIAEHASNDKDQNEVFENMIIRKNGENYY